ncbi:MAG: hypothetical protein EWV75_03420 [Microcystis wesenbergii Mw_QC_S_20081001_S30D]|uniref:Uncharacterized protein n=1 Tax=Microcystis wesenbergii Mw_QC_S_20081001_S30D TaxID=2486245 RepID=A0A552JX37_9CHRO|nr:MAG: hypothetical protein EWV75_03420 [Microcystis wesenbergii Mw_QC_S_20081001_S30D]TRV04678.1 MAG: hypothetical protein EWV74_04465 [Microcystis wesenbergii Mw_QC_S_20081001_S30]
MNPLVNYFRNLQEIYSSQAAVKETSYYGTLETLLNEIGKTLKPRVRCIINLRNQGAAILILKTKEDKVLYVNKRTSV